MHGVARAISSFEKKRRLSLLTLIQFCGTFGRLQKRRQETKRGLQGRRKQKNVGNRGKKSMMLEAGTVVLEERSLGIVTMTVIVTMTAIVEEKGLMITEIEDQNIEAVPTEMVGILKETDTDIGVMT